MKASHEILSEGHFFGNFIEKFVGIKKKKGGTLSKKRSKMKLNKRKQDYLRKH